MLSEVIDPYLVWIKLGAVGLVLGLCFGGGCHVQKARDTSKIESLNTQLGAAGAALTAVNTETKAKEVAATAAAKRASEAAQRSADAAKALSRELAGIQSDIDAAKHDPKCKQSLETKVCARLL